MRPDDRILRRRLVSFTFAISNTFIYALNFRSVHLGGGRSRAITEFHPHIDTVWPNFYYLLIYVLLEFDIPLTECEVL